MGPGVTGNCPSNPCRVFFQMPKGSGTYEVTGNAMVYGTYPAGKTVSLGSLFERPGPDEGPDKQNDSTNHDEDRDRRPASRHGPAVGKEHGHEGEQEERRCEEGPEHRRCDRSRQ